MANATSTSITYQKSIFNVTNTHWDGLGAIILSKIAAILITN